MDETRPKPAPNPGMTLREAEMLRDVRKLMERKPEAVLQYLAGNQPPTKALVALALSAQLEITKQKMASMQVTIALCKFLKVGESNTNDVEDNHGHDATPDR